MGPITVAAAAAALAIHAEPNSSPGPLKPSGPWTVDYADDMCVLQRTFGSKEQQVTLGLKPGPLGESMRLVLIQPEDAAGKGQGVARVSFDDAKPVDAGYWSVPLQKRQIDVTLVDMKRDQLAPLQRAKSIRIRAGKVDVALAPTMFSQALTALEACEKDLLVSWGMDPAALSSITTFPKPRGGALHRFFSTSDYPMAALRNNEQGTAGVRFWVGKDGKVRDCKVVESSGSVTIDSQTCATISQRGRFEPARTSSGTAVESISYTRVRWELPGM